MSSGPGWPVKTDGSPQGPGGVAHIDPTSHGPWPGPAHQLSRGWAATGAGPSIFQRMCRGPAHHFHTGWAAARHGPSKLQRMGRDPTKPITLNQFYGPVRSIKFRNVLARFAHDCLKRFGRARPGPASHNPQIGPARSVLDTRPITSALLLTTPPTVVYSTNVGT